MQELDGGVDEIRPFFREIVVQDFLQSDDELGAGVGRGAGDDGDETGANGGFLGGGDGDGSRVAVFGFCPAFVDAVLEVDDGCKSISMPRIG